MAMRPETEAALERGRSLYNAAQYYEAHEVWEGAWLGERGEVRLLLQGLIQVAAGYFKALIHRQPRGASRLLASGLEKLAPLPESCAGLSLGPFRQGVARSLEEVRRWNEGTASGLDSAPAPPLERAG